MFDLLDLVLQAYTVAYGLLSLAVLLAALFAAVFSKEDPRFEGDKLGYRS